MASIEQLKSLISSKGGVARMNVFAIELPSMAGVTSRDVNILCRDVVMPGRQILTHERMIGIKPTKTAYAYGQEDITATFLLLNDYGIKKYFETWQNKVIDFENNQIKYKDEYVQPVIKIKQMKKGHALPIYSTELGIPKLPAELQNRLPKMGPFDLAQGEFSLDFEGADEPVYEVELRNVFPTTMNALQLNNEGTLLELNVTLSYDNWTSKFHKQAGQERDLQAALLGGLAAKFLN